MTFPQTQAFVQYSQSFNALQGVGQAARRVLYYIVNEPNGDQNEVLQRLILLTTRDNEVTGLPEAQAPEYGSLRDACWAEIEEYLADRYPQALQQPTRPKPAMKIAGMALLGTAAVLLAPAMAVGALGVVGFGAAGPVAGSLAALLQSTIFGGAVGAGSWFALAQAAAMGGIAVTGAQVAAGVAVAGAGVGAMAAAPRRNQA